jgi:RNA polymerase sigma-70 factor (ECF subfamily)
MRTASSTSSSLLEKIQNLGDSESWDRFVKVYWRLIFQTARKAGLSKADAEDVVQVIFVTVAEKMPGFVYDRKRGSFRSWLLRVTHSKITDFLRKQQRRVTTVPGADEDDGTDLIDRLPDPESLAWQQEWDREWRANLMDAAIERAKGKVTLKQFQIFHSNVVDELPAARVAEAFGVSVTSVYLAKHRVGRVVAREFRKLERMEDSP